jgi:signal transduction histidine kinase
MLCMNSLSDARPASRRKPWIGLLVAVFVIGLTLTLGWMLMTPAVRLPAFAMALLAGLGLALVLLTFAALGWHVGVRLTRERMGEALREARGQVHLLTQLQDDWQWQTDAEHHLVRWQAPQAAPASTWVGAAATQSLWERFALSDGSDASLLQRLQEQASFGEVLVHGRLEAGAAAQFSGHWWLRGVARQDASGRFSGFVGTARPAMPGDRAAGRRAEVADAAVASRERSDGARSTDWIHALPGPAWLLAEEPGRGSVLSELNAAASQLMGVPAEGLRGQSWLACLDGLPADIRAAACAPGATQGLSCGNWWLCLSPVPGPAAGMHLLSLWPQGALDTMPATLAIEAAEVARAEHESFSYTVSHDLRAPLRVVEGFARILKEDYGRLLDRIGNDHLDRVMGAATRMNSMIDALLSLTRLSSQPLQHQPVPLSQLAELVMEELRRSAPERQVSVQVQPDLVVQGDPTLLRMVLENLLGNAWKYSSKCTQAEIRFERQQQGGQLVYMISDNGAGFDMRFAERLFGVFQRLHSASDFQGTGVGLASVRRIVHRHGGEIWAEAEVGKGARFFFTLR